MRAPFISLLLLTITATTGCRSIPFEDVERVSMADKDPVVVRLKCELTLARKFESQDALLFSFFGRKMGALGVISVDEPADRFTVVCMSHAGMKLFDVRGENGEISTAFALPEFKKRGDIGQMVGQDIRDAYFGRVPARTAAVTRKRKSIIYSDSNADLVFAGITARLVEKRIRREGRHVSTVRYYNYRRTDKGIRPTGIVIDNHKYKYRLIVRATEEAEGLTGQ